MSADEHTFKGDGVVTVEPRRKTVSERLHEISLAAIQRPSSPPEHSVEITRNAKGVHQYEVTVRGFNLSEVLGQALDARAMLDELLPYPEDES